MSYLFNLVKFRHKPVLSDLRNFASFPPKNKSFRAWNLDIRIILRRRFFARSFQLEYLLSVTNFIGRNLLKSLTVLNNHSQKHMQMVTKVVLIRDMYLEV